MFRYILLTLMVIFEASELLANSPNFIILYADDLGYADTSVQMMDSDPSPDILSFRHRGLSVLLRSVPVLPQPIHRLPPVRDHE